MVRRSFVVIDIVEVLEHWYAGRPKLVVAQSLGVAGITYVTRPGCSSPRRRGSPAESWLRNSPGVRPSGSRQYGLAIGQQIAGSRFSGWGTPGRGWRSLAGCAEWAPMGCLEGRASVRSAFRSALVLRNVGERRLTNEQSGDCRSPCAATVLSHDEQ